MKYTIKNCEIQIVYVFLMMFMTTLMGCENKTPIKVGFVGCLSGRLSDLGTAGRNGVMLAIEQVNETKEEHPDLIVMDIQMPEISGLEAIRHIRTNERIQSVPIIAVTALAMPGDRERCLEAGANEYLSKPVILQKLSEILERLLANREKKE